MSKEKMAGALSCTFLLGIAVYVILGISFICFLIAKGL